VRRRRQIREYRRVLYRNLFLVVIAIRNPCLNGRTVEVAGNEPLMEGMFIVIALRADSEETFDEIGAGRRALQLRRMDRPGKISRHLGAQRMLLEIGALPA